MFYIKVFKDTLCYEVDEINVVEPDDVSNLAIEPGEDLCTLVTCTPYGVDTHRLLVRGHRIDNDGLLHILADAYEIDPKVAAPVASALIILVIETPVLVVSLIRRKRLKR